MLRFHFHRKNIFKKTTELVLVRLLVSLALGAIATVWALHISSLGFSDSAVGFITAFLYLVAFLSAFLTIPVLEEFDEVKILFTAIFIGALAYFLIPFTQSQTIFIILAMFVAAAAVFRVDSFDILFRDESKAKELNQNEGLMYSFIDLGWLVGPLAAGYVLLKYGSESVFYLGSLFLILAMIVLFTIKIKAPKKERDHIDKDLIGNFRDFISNPDATKPFLISSGVYMWWTLILIFAPLFIVNAGLDNSVVGMFIAFVFLPLVMSEYMISKLSVKYGFKRFFVFGYFIFAILSLILFVTANVEIMMLLLIFGSVGISFIEPIQDAYFFKKIRKNDEEKFYPFYATAEFFGFFTASVLIGGVLLFMPDHYAFAVMFVLSLILLTVARTVKH